MASALNTKINSYAIENGIEFDQAVAVPPTQTGTITENTPAYWALLGRSPVYEPSVGPIGGSGSWRFTGNSANGSRLRNNGGTILTLSGDGDYSIGFWAKANSLRPASASESACVLYLLANPTTIGFSVNVTGGSHSTPNRVAISATGTTTITDVTMNTTDWYYFAVTKTGTNLNFYINNVLKASRTNMQTANASVQNWADASPIDGYEVNISNWYYASTSVIGPTQIAEIWTAGSGINKNIQETPATATALMVESICSTTSNKLITETPATATALINQPTIVIVANDNVQVTTSFLASIEFPQNVVAAGVKNVNNVITEVLTASTELINNVIISTSTDDSFSAAEFIATAELLDPFVAREPLTASATMPGGIASVTPNYYSLVKALNPYLYVHSGSANPVNHGYQTGTFSKDLNLRTDLDLGNPLNLIAEGKSWLGPPGSSTNGRFIFTTSTAETSFNELVSNGTFTWEAWVKPHFVPTGNSDPTFYFVNGPLKIYTAPRRGTTFAEPSSTPLLYVKIANSPTTFASFSIPSSSTPLSGGNWAHVVVQSFDDGTAGVRRAELWINGTRYITEQYAYNNWTSTSADAVIFGTVQTSQFGTVISSNENLGIDEVAIYQNALTNSQIINHYNFISQASPNVSYQVATFDADVESGNHAVIAIDNAIIAETPATATTLLVDPSVLAVKNISISSTTLTASALNTNVTVYYGWTINASPAIAYADRPEAYFLNDVYYQYVQTNIAPYRYVTFDAADTLLDYGTDNDYSVAPTVVGGIIVNPDLGITGKSAKTAGTSYVTDGVILNESEWNDSWGTGANDWHSAFWFQRALDDNSTTGLRVLWNLNGYKDNQHAVLYQYQGRLHMQFNNGSGTFIETDSTALDLFDYQRHFIVINHDHGGGNSNTIKLYVDSVLRFTVNIGSITPTTTNAATADSGPNNEANNRPRLSVGCLVTPFGSTALPVQPTTTKLIIDEVYWDKDVITQTQVTNLYNAMPDKNNKIVVVEPFIASDELIMPAFSTSSILSTAPLTASASLVQPGITAVRNLVTTATVLTASASAGDARVFEDRIIIADVFVATAVFNSAGAVITIPGGPMTASVELVNRSRPFVNPTNDFGISVSTNGIRYELNQLSPYIKYLRIVARNQKIYKDMEIL
jgi:hypothetical protein